MTLPFDYVSSYGFPQGSFVNNSRKLQLDDILNSMRNGAMRANTDWKAPQPYQPPQQSQMPASVADLVRAMVGGGAPANPSTPTPAAPSLGTAAPASDASPAPLAAASAAQAGGPSVPQIAAPAPMKPAQTQPAPGLFSGPGAPDFSTGPFGGQQGGQGGQQQGQGIIPQFMNAMKGFQGGGGGQSSGIIGGLSNLFGGLGGMGSAPAVLGGSF